MVFETPYNLTNVINSTDITVFAQRVGSDILVQNYLLGYLIMLMVFGVMFFSLKSRGHFTSASFAAAAWVTTLVTILLRAINLVDDWGWYVGVIASVIAVGILYMDSSGK